MARPRCGWLVHEHGIEPHVTVFDKSARRDGTFSRDDFTYDHASDAYSCPGGSMPTCSTESAINVLFASRRTAAKFTSLFDEAGGGVRDMTEIDRTGEHA
jgi:hypothetical protein